MAAHLRNPDAQPQLQQLTSTSLSDLRKLSLLGLCGSLVRRGRKPLHGLELASLQQNFLSDAVQHSLAVAVRLRGFTHSLWGVPGTVVYPARVGRARSLLDDLLQLLLVAPEHLVVVLAILALLQLKAFLALPFQLRHSL